VKLTTVQIEILDVLSRKVNQYIDEKTAPMLAAMAAGTKQLFEHDPRMRKQLKGAGVTIKDYAEREIDMPLYEPHTGLRSFFGQALRPQIEEQLLLYDLVPIRNALGKTWFEHGDFGKLRPDLQRVVARLAARKNPTPMTIYREQEGRLDRKPGDTLAYNRPHSFSATEKVMMGETTVVATTRYGTNVSVLSKYLGEAEVVSFCPQGYIVTKVEDHTFGGKQTRRVVFVRDRP
jgi:hypothetical protein